MEIDHDESMRVQFKINGHIFSLGKGEEAKTSGGANVEYSEKNFGSRVCNCSRTG